MSEQLHEAAERARLERRRRLAAEVAPYLTPGERVQEATTGGGAASGPAARPRDPGAIRVVVTDHRMILLRKKAFRQFAVQEFSFDTSRVWLGFTAEAGGELEVSDSSRRNRVTVSGVPELDLEPLFLALRDRMAGDRLDVWLDPAPPERPSVVPADLDGLIDVDHPAAPEPVVGLPELESVPAHVGASTIEEIPVAAASPPESVDGSVPAVRVGHAGAEGEGASAHAGRKPSSPAGSTPPDEPTIDAPVIIPDDELELSVKEASGAVQAGILRWLLASTGAEAALYLHRTPDGEEHLEVEPRRLDARLAMSLVRRATEATGGPIPPPESDDETFVTCWGQTGEERVLVLSGAVSAGGDVTAFARFVLERLESPPSGRERGATGEGDRPALLDVAVGVEEDGRPSADVRLSWRGQELAGHGLGHTSILGRHLAVARAVTDALRPLVQGDLVVEHVLLSYPPMDAELVVATVLVGARRFVGATAGAPGDEEAAAARAVLDALNRNLAEIT